MRALSGTRIARARSARVPRLLGVVGVILFQEADRVVKPGPYRVVLLASLEESDLLTRLRSKLSPEALGPPGRCQGPADDFAVGVCLAIPPDPEVTLVRVGV